MDTINWRGVIAVVVAASIFMLMFLSTSGAFKEVNQQYEIKQALQAEQIEQPKEVILYEEGSDYISFKKDKTTKELRQVPPNEEGASKLYLYVEETRVRQVKAISNDGKSITMMYPSAKFRIDPNKVQSVLSQPKDKRNFFTIPFSGIYIMSVLDGMNTALTEGLMSYINNNDAATCGNIEATKAEIGRILSTYLDKEYGEGVFNFTAAYIQEIF